jgi:uncharacterized protein (DUF2147 family)
LSTPAIAVALALAASPASAQWVQHAGPPEPPPAKVPQAKPAQPARPKETTATSKPAEATRPAAPAKSALGGPSQSAAKPAQSTGASSGGTIAQGAPARAAPTTPVAPARPPAPAQAQPPNPFHGLWLDHTGDGAVEVGPCGPGEKERDLLCGNIFWLRQPLNAKGEHLRDLNNEDARQKKRPICGLPVILGLKRQQNGTYDEGYIYDPRQGKQFNVELSMKAPDKLQVMGYKGVKFLSRTYLWTRIAAPQPLPQRCLQPPPV